MIEAVPNIKTHGKTYFILLHTTNVFFFISCCYTYFLDSSLGQLLAPKQIELENSAMSQFEFNFKVI